MQTAIVFHRIPRSRRRSAVTSRRASMASRMTAILAQTERKRQDRSVRCAEKHRRRARTRRLRGLIHSVPAACATKAAGWGKKCLTGGQNQALFTSDSMPLGVCREKTLTQWTKIGERKSRMLFAEGLWAQKSSKLVYDATEKGASEIHGR